ncbi:MAG: S8 family serine peptidase [Planctomycetota bacterium]|nr:S8 family serine peptidase [Planctomycetota bacterium]
MLADVSRDLKGRGRVVAALAVTIIVALLVGQRAPQPRTPDDSQARIHPALNARLQAEGAPVKAWVFFADKGLASEREYAEAIQRLHETYDRRAIERRRLRRTAPGLFDRRDIPVADDHVQAVASTGAELHITSRWLNAVSAWVTGEQARAIAALPFVKSIEPVRRARRIEPPTPEGDGPAAPLGRGFYGAAEEQLEQINLIALHNDGATGEGVIIGILDTGFERTHEAFNHPDHPLEIVDEYDFIDNDDNTAEEPGDPDYQYWHGTLILGTLGAYMPNELVGAAYDASFILCKTEDTSGEYQGEEDNYVAGLEFIESLGGDVSTSSLSYHDWYTQDDYDGETAVTTIAVNAATENGMYCCTAASNQGHDNNPNTSHLGAPADAFQVLTCGAVESTGEIAGFSSDGPTADGRVKPEVLARGVSTHTVNPGDDDGYDTASGTSLSTPLVAGAVACIAQAQSTWTVDQLRDFLFFTADYYLANGTYDPLYIYGYGVIDAWGAVAQDCNHNGAFDDEDIDNGTSEDVNDNGIPDECECLADCADPPDGVVNTEDLLALLGDWGQSGTPRDINFDGIVNTSDLLILLGAWGPCPE